MTTISTPPGFPNGPPDVRDARLTLDGRLILAPIPLIRAVDAQGNTAPLNQIAVLGPVRDGILETARLLTGADGVAGGPYHAGISPDADSALIGGAFDSGSTNLVTGLSYGSAYVRTRLLPFSLFGRDPLRTAKIRREVKAQWKRISIPIGRTAFRLVPGINARGNVPPSPAIWEAGRLRATWRQLGSG